ncbi:hypothetical protein [Pseudomonas koreensis]|uniref:hypothetical protein n=1 Tax=Pseudomonas koreensis TaxID=198620 RepID=UPI001E585472|nr:hypothetical protein [Pseudomonas koreensis]
MSYVFDDLQKSMVLQAASISEGMWFDQDAQRYKASAEQGRNCANFYRVLSKIIGEKISEDIFSEKDVVDVLKSARLWLDVAIDANGGQGAYSALIRAYTMRQGELRSSKRFTDSEMQKSSNQYCGCTESCFLPPGSGCDGVERRVWADRSRCCHSSRRGKAGRAAIKLGGGVD